MKDEKTKSAFKEFIRAVLASLVAFITALFTSSCGITRAIIKTNADNTASTITITTNNPTSVDVTPNTTLSYETE